MLSGNAGSDKFRFNLRTEVGDRITDFQSGVDDLVFVRSAFGNISKIDRTNFISNTTGRAGDASDRFIFETDTSRLFFDADGNGRGGAILVATLTNVTSLAAGDFLLI